MMSGKMRLSIGAIVFLAGCTTTGMNGANDHSDHDTMPAAASVSVPANAGLPADAATARARLASSPRHGEWVTYKSGSDSIRAWVVYPQRKNNAPVVVVVHEIYGLTPWIRAVADQFASEGYIAIAPDLLTMKGLPNATDSVPSDLATAAIRTLNPDDVQRYIDATASYAMALPSAQKKYGIVGFCWGGGISFQHAVHSPALGASVVYYGVSPSNESLTAVKAPVLGLYGGSDARVGATVPPADSTMRALGKTFTHYSYDGASHGFLRQQSGQAGANLTATQQAWPATIVWFRRYLGA
ncbi:MAG: dienelactone hydrolase family protein [Gemmatimonadales bacterium]